MCVTQLQGALNLGNTSIIICGVWLIVTLSAFKVELSIILRERRFLYLLVFLVFYFLSSSLNNSIIISVNRCMAFISVISPILVFETLKDKSEKLKKLFIVTFFVVFGIDIYLSYSFLTLMDETNLRQGNTEYTSLFYILTIVFNLCFVFSLLIPCLIDIVINNKKLETIKRLLILLVAVGLFLFLCKAQFMTAIMLSLIGCIVAWFYKYGKKSIVAVGIALALCGFAFVSFYPSLRNSVDKWGEYQTIIYRLDEIHAVLTGNKSDASDMNTRQDLSMMSFNTFMRNPIIGVNHKISSDYHVNEQGIGNHACWLDFLAYYGLFSIFIFLFIWKSLSKQKQYTGKLLPVILFVVLGFLDPLWYFPQLATIYLLVPLLYDVASAS